MKSKPPSKKARLDPPPPQISLEGVPSRSTANASPCGSTSSSASSLLSIPPPTSASTPKASTATTASELVAAAKMAAATAKAQAAAAASILARASSAPSYPILIQPEISEFPRTSTLMSYGKGGSGETKPSIAPGSEGILSMEDVDALQGELETIWSTMATRIRALKVEQAILQNSPSSGNVAAVLGEHYDPHHQEKINAVASLIDAGHGTRTSVSAAAKLVMGSQIAGGSPASSGAGTGLSKKTAKGDTRLDKLPKKKLKGDAAGTSKKGNEKPARATQNRSHSVSSDFGGLDGFYKHEAPSEFWEFADNYCGEVTAEHLVDLAKVIDEHKIVPDNLFDIPPLGKHFRDGEDSKMKTRDSKPPKRVDACGPLTQRLVSALVDERVAMYNNHRNHSLGSPREDGTPGGGGNHEQGFIHRAGLIKALGLDSGPNRPPMENQLRECLLDRGFLHPDDANDPLLFNPDDEILGELKRTQNTFKKLHQYNQDKLNELYNKAQRELERSAYKKELEKADKEVIEAYKNLASMRLKKKPITKKEKDVAVKALENRDRVLLKLSPTTIKTESVGPATILKVEV